MKTDFPTTATIVVLQLLNWWRPTLSLFLFFPSRIIYCLTPTSLLFYNQQPTWLFLMIQQFSVQVIFLPICFCPSLTFSSNLLILIHHSTDSRMFFVDSVPISCSLVHRSDSQFHMHLCFCFFLYLFFLLLLLPFFYQFAPSFF